MSNLLGVNREEYTSHIKDMDDLSEMRRILDIIEIVKRDHLISSTDFLNPYLCELSRSILNRFGDIGYKEIGGLDNSERKVILIYPDYHYLVKEDYPISALRLTGDMQGLSHPDFLGGVLNLGITRDKMGDILVHDTHADIVVKDEIKEFILLNLDKIGNKNFEIEEVELDELTPVKEEFVQVDRTLSSLRLDAYIGAAYDVSRGISQKIIDAGNARVNWEPIDKPSFEISEGDLISIRGYGRSRLYSIDGRSRKNRLLVKIRRII